MSSLTQEEKSTFDISTCDPKVYAEILDHYSYYQARNNTKAANAFLTLKQRMETSCDMKSITRALGMVNHSYIIKPKPKKFTLRGFDILEIHENGSISFYTSEEKTVKIPEPLNDAQVALRNLESPNFDEEYRKRLFPEICSEDCKFVTCPYRTFENYGKPCQMRFEQYKSKPNQFETRTLDPNTPQYNSPQFRQEKRENPKEPFKESLEPR